LQENVSDEELHKLDALEEESNKLAYKIYERESALESEEDS
jgi:hypothetical protein